MGKLTPFGLTIRQLRLGRHERLGDMAKALEVTSSYLSAVEHGLKATNDSFVKKVWLYFSNEQIDLAEWQRLANDSQPQMKLDLNEHRELKLAFGRSIDHLPLATLKQLRELLCEQESVKS